MIEYFSSSDPKAMQSLPKGVTIYINRLIYASRMKELLREYHSLYLIDMHERLRFKNTMRFAANYRDIHPIMCTIKNIYTLYSKETGCLLSKRYFYSSGLNSIEGYNNKMKI